MLIKQTPVEASRAASLQKRCELSEIYLLACESQREADLRTRTEPFNLELAFKGVGAVVEDGFRAVVEFSVLSRDSGVPPQQAFRMDCKLQVDYDLTSEPVPTDEEIASFASANAVFNCWPYARELFQNLASRMLLRVPPLPYLRIATVPVPEMADSAIAPLDPSMAAGQKNNDQTVGISSTVTMSALWS